jgi:hypothetical protein
MIRTLHGLKIPSKQGEGRHMYPLYVVREKFEVRCGVSKEERNLGSTHDILKQEEHKESLVLSREGIDANE